MPGAVRGNVGTTLEHLVLTEAMRYVCNTVDSPSWIHYVDTHAMNPLNVPFREEGLFRDLWRNDIPKQLVGLSPFFRVVQDSRSANRCLYPSHVVFAARAARDSGRRVWASLFEIKEMKWPEIEDFLHDPGVIPGQGLTPDHVQGSLGRGTFRAPALWEQARAGIANANVQPAARILYCDPMSYALDDDVPQADHDNRMNRFDLEFLRAQLPDSVPTFFIMFTNEQDRDRFPARAERYAQEYAASFDLGPATDYTWCMFRANNSAVFVASVGFGSDGLRQVRNGVLGSLNRARDEYHRNTAIDVGPGER